MSGIYAHDTIEPQILSVSRTPCGSEFKSTTNNCQSPRSPDYVIVNIGGNDLGFGEIVRDLLAACNAECLQALKQGIDRELRILHTNLGELKKSIDKWSPKNVLLSEYSTQSEKGLKRRYCKDKAFGDRVLTFSIAPMFGYAIDEKESQFAHEQVVVPLNNELRHFAGDQPNRRLVGKLAEASQSMVIAATEVGSIPTRTPRQSRGIFRSTVTRYPTRSSEEALRRGLCTQTSSVSTT